MKKLLSALCAALVILLMLFSPAYLRLSRTAPETPGITERKLKTIVIWQLGALVKSGGEILRSISAFENSSEGTRVFLRLASFGELKDSAALPDLYLFTPDSAPPRELLSGEPLPYYSEFYSLVYPLSALEGEEFSLERLLSLEPLSGQTFCALSQDFSALALALIGCKCEYRQYPSAQAVKKALLEGEALCAVLPDTEASKIVSENDAFAVEVLPNATERTVYIGISPGAKSEALELCRHLTSQASSGGFTLRGLYFHALGAGEAILPDPFTFPKEREAQLARALEALRSGSEASARAIWGAAEE